MIKYFRPKDLGKGKIGDVKIEYGKSYIYTKKDMNKAIDVILNAFEEGYADCELYNIRYDSDNSDSDEILKWMNELADAQKLDIGFTQSIKFYSDFNTTSGFKNESGIEANEEYKDWQWYLARSGKGNWYLLSWGIRLINKVKQKLKSTLSGAFFIRSFIKSISFRSFQNRCGIRLRSAI